MWETFEQKMEGIQRLGIDQAVALGFRPALAAVSATDLLRRLICGRLNACEVYLGHGFAFGHNREGHFALLEQVAADLGRAAEEVPEIRLRSHRISSTMIRRLLTAGRINLARRMLGRPYGIESRVIEGRRVAGAQLNYPTANLKPHNTVTPMNGVYVPLPLIDGEGWRPVTNVGHKPTFGGEPEVTVETHVIDFDREL